MTHCRYAISLLVLIFALSLSLHKGHGEEFGPWTRLDSVITKRGKLPKEKLRCLREAAKVQKMYSEWLMENVEIVGSATGMGSDGEA